MSVDQTIPSPLHCQPQTKLLLPASAHMTFNRDFSKEIRGEGDISQLIHMQ